MIITSWLYRNKIKSCCHQTTPLHCPRLLLRTPDTSRLIDWMWFVRSHGIYEFLNCIVPHGTKWLCDLKFKFHDHYSTQGAIWHLYEYYHTTALPIHSFLVVVWPNFDLFHPFYARDRTKTSTWDLTHREWSHLISGSRDDPSTTRPIIFFFIYVSVFSEITLYWHT